MHPLVPANVDLRDFPYMPLDVVRLRDSRLATVSSGEGFRCAVLLWCASWHQVPASSLPDDDALLSQYAGFGRSVREWKKHKPEAMHGWELCDDGRWYHATVAEKALEAWAQRLRQRWRTECARIKKAAQRAGVDAAYPTFEQWEAHYEATGQEQWRPGLVPNQVPRDEIEVSPGTSGNVPRETASKGREGKGREALKAKTLSPDTLSHTPPAAAVSGVFEGHADPRAMSNPAAPHAIALIAAGFQCTGMNPELVAFVESGGTVEHLQQVASLPECAGKPAGYVVKIARRELAERALPITPSARTGPSQRQPGKQLQGLMALEELKSGNRVDPGRDRNRLAEAVPALPGTYSVR